MVFCIRAYWFCQLLGDYTSGRETVLLDNVQLKAGASNSIPAGCYAEMDPFSYRR